MLHTAKIIGTGLGTTGLIGAGVGIGGCVRVDVRTFSASKRFKIDSNNGRDLDSILDIAKKFEGDKKGLDKYFEEKSESITRDYRTDSNSAAISGVDAAELDFWLGEKNKMLAELEEQKEVSEVLAMTSDAEESDKDSESAEKPSNNDAEDSNFKDNKSVTSTSDTNDNPGNTFKQDSSEVTQTDFSSFEPFDD